MATLASDWLTEAFRLLLFNRWTEFNKNLTESKISTSSTKFVLFGPIGKPRWPPWPLIGWDIFAFFSTAVERNSTKLRQEARYQRPPPNLCFSDRLENQDGHPGHWLAETFSPSSLQPSNGIQRNLDRKQDINVLYQVCVFWPIGKTRWPPLPLIRRDIFDFWNVWLPLNSATWGFKTHA